MASESIRIEPFTPKKFRYTFSSTLIQKGVPKELIVKQLDNQPLISKTKQQIDEFFDSTMPESCMKNPHENENLSLQLEKDWVGILLPLLYMYSEVNNYCAMNSTPRCKEILVQSVEIADKLIYILNQAMKKNEPIVIGVNYFELEVIVDTIELKIQMLKSDDKTVEPVLEDIHEEFHRKYHSWKGR